MRSARSASDTKAPPPGPEALASFESQFKDVAGPAYGWVIEAFDALPEEYRVASMLYFMQDFTYREIAAVFEIPIGTIRSRLHRERKMLQRALWQVACDAGIVAAVGAGEAITCGR